MSRVEVCLWFRRRRPLLGVAVGLAVAVTINWCFEGPWVPAEQVMTAVPQLTEQGLRDNDIYFPVTLAPEDTCTAVAAISAGPFLLVRGYLSHDNARFPSVTTLKKAPVLPFYIVVSTYVYESDKNPLDWGGQFRHLIFQYDFRMNVVTDEVRSNVTAYIPLYGWAMLIAVAANLFFGEKRYRQQPK